MWSEGLAGVVAAAALLLAPGITNDCGYGNPEKASPALRPDHGGVILSVGAAKPCLHAATALEVLPAEGQKAGVMLQIDNGFTKSEFPDHKGSLHVLALPAGRYTLRPVPIGARSTSTPTWTFSVTPGEFAYIGEMWLRTSCTGAYVGPSAYSDPTIVDQEARDLALVRQRNPAFASVVVAKHLATFDRIDASGKW